VFEHNAMDVLSLVTLTVHLARIFGGEARMDGADRLALGRACEAESRHDEAVAHYEAALALALRPAEEQDCERRLSLLYRKLGRWDDAAALWSQIAARPGSRALYPLIELAKYHERVSRDIAAARAHTERALLLLEHYHAHRGYRGLAAERDALQKRLLRLAEREARALAAASRKRRQGVAAMPAPHQSGQ
jgi:uncharacterized protein